MYTQESQTVLNSLNRKALIKTHLQCIILGVLDEIQRQWDYIIVCFTMVCVFWVKAHKNKLNENTAIKLVYI